MVGFSEAISQVGEVPCGLWLIEKLVAHDKGVFRGGFDTCTFPVVALLDAQMRSSSERSPDLI